MIVPSVARSPHLCFVEGFWAVHVIRVKKRAPLSRFPLRICPSCILGRSDPCNRPRVYSRPGRCVHGWNEAMNERIRETRSGAVWMDVTFIHMDWFSLSTEAGKFPT